MNDEIRKISCLSCGGQLLVNPDQSITQCPYCGNTYLLKDLLDQTPLCPICNKNDRVIQASGINKEDPKYRDLRFNLKDFYLPDDDIELDDKSKTISVIGWIMVIAPLILIQFFTTRFSNQPLGCWIPLGVSIVLGAGLFFYAVNQYNATKTKKAQKENIREALKELNKIEFDRLKPIYYLLYYCRRDDIVFLPNMGDHAKPEEMRKYLRDHA